MRECTKCGKKKPESDYYAYKDPKRKRMGACRECHKAAVADHQKRNPEKAREWRREADRKYYERHREQRQEVMRRYRAANRDTLLAKRKKWREANKERLAAEWREYQAKNRETINARARERYDPEKKRARRTPEQARRARERRRARKLEAFVADVDLDEIIVRDEGHCGICGEPIVDNTLELDHVIPLAAGGTHEPDNVQLAHRACNRRKGTRLNYSASKSDGCGV